MPSEIFLMDHGSGHTSRLRRTQIIRKHWSKYVWREDPPGVPVIQFDEDDEGRPIDAFGLPLLGEFAGEHTD